MRSKFFHLYAAALFAVLLLPSCNPDPFREAEESIASYNFAKATEILDGLKTGGENSGRRALLSAKAHLVEGNLKRGFADLADVEETDGNPEKTRAENARLLLDAAKIIIREKSRAGEVLIIMDSVLVRDPGLRIPVQKVVWDRGMEYMSVSGDAGYRFLKYAIANDPKVFGRLRGFNRAVAHRYEIMDDAYGKLQVLNQNVDRFRATYKRNPDDLQELVSLMNLRVEDVQIDGWVLGWHIADGVPVITAEVGAQGVKSGVPDGTVLGFP